VIAGDVATLGDVLALTPAEQSAIGFFCGGQVATPNAGIETCASNFGATRVTIPAPGTADDDHNPGRLAPRHLFDLAFGTDKLFTVHEAKHVTARVTIANLGNQITLYNFHSTFSGTHFVGPRTYTGAIGLVF
jgi:hypothetical protein